MMNVLHEHDVLFGRGVVINAHSGNQRLREMVERCKPEFLASKRNARRKIAIKIVDEIYALQPPGRFLMEDPNGGGRGSDESMLSSGGGGSTPRNIHKSLLGKAWMCQETEKAIEKVLHRLREKDTRGGSCGAKAKQPAKEEIPKKLPPPAVASQAKPTAVTSSTLQGTNVLRKEQQSIDSKSASNITPETDPARISSTTSLPPFGSSFGSIEDNEFGVNVTETEQHLVDSKAGISIRDGDVTDGELQSFLHQLHEGAEVGAQQQQQEKISSQQHGKGLEKGRVVTADSSDDFLFGMQSNKHNEQADLAGSNTISQNVDNLDDELDSFLQDFSSRHDGNNETLPEWIARTLLRLNQKSTMSIQSSRQASEYVKAALPIALKLTEFLNDSEKVGNALPIPLSGISSGNVIVRTKYLSEGHIVHGVNAEQHHKEVVEGVWIMSPAGHSPHDTDMMSRLFALGLLLYELISGEELPFEDGTETVPIPSNPVSMNSINLNRNIRSSKPFQRQSSIYPERISNCIDRLESLNIPWSLRFLLGNLLDCSNGDLHGEYAYTSFDDLQADLHLILSDPDRFLNNIETNPIPTLSICNKLYGREVEMKRLEKSYHKYLSKTCSGVIINGEAGVGKSSLGKHVVQQLTNQAQGYFLVAKYDQNKDFKPLSSLLALFNTLCDLFAQEATPSQLGLVDTALETALGGKQAAFLAGLLPSLSKIMPMCAGLSPPREIDFTMSLRFLFSELLGVIAYHSRHISFFLDDLQWADEESLLLIESLIRNNAGSSSVFFTCCYRDADFNDTMQFNRWLNSVSIHFSESIKLGNLTNNNVNQLVSDTLHLSPRITQPLSSVLHHKTRGNPFFLKQLIEQSLKDKGFIYVNLSQPRWDFDLEKIMELEISDDVLSLLIEDLQGLPGDLLLGLKVASCLGSCAKFAILDILSSDFRTDLQGILQQVSTKGFMKNVGGTMFRFEHDKIQQASYELFMSDQQRSECHMRIGLAICAHTMNTNADNEELFFSSVNQMNKGGVGVVHDPIQRNIIAALNLRAGMRAIMFDTNGAKQLFEHGISFLCSDHWDSEYNLSINLYDAVVESACVLTDRAAVTFYTEELISHARCYDDKLICLYAASRVLRQAELKQESMETTFAILEQLGEDRLRPMGDAELNQDMQKMDMLLAQRTDNSFFNMTETINEKKILTLMKLYSNLILILHFLQPSLVGAASLRMVEITFENGFCSLTPLAYAFYGEVAASIGELDSGNRLAGLALKLLEKKGSSRHKASVIAIVYQSILWASTPFQAIVEGLMIGHKAGLQSGDYLYSSLNLYLAIISSYISGHHLNDIRENSRKYALKKPDDKAVIIERGYGSMAVITAGHPSLLHLQSCVLIEGLQVLDAECVDGLPGKKEIIADATNAKDQTILLTYEIHRRTNALLFDELDGISLGLKISDIVSQNKTLLRPALIFALFVEGLICYNLARQTDEKHEWIRIGEFVRKKMATWAESCAWNFENKMLLLDAEHMFTLTLDSTCTPDLPASDHSGNVDRAESLYIRSIISAKEHKFIHEEAIASKLAGDFFFERGHYSKAYSLFTHSIECYMKWGATAVAAHQMRFVQNNFDPDSMLPVSLASILDAHEASSSKKRQEAK